MVKINSFYKLLQAGLQSIWSISKQVINNPIAVGVISISFTILGLTSVWWAVPSIALDILLIYKAIQKKNNIVTNLTD